MDDDRLTVKEVFDGLYDFVWRNDDPLARFGRTIFLINYPIFVLFCAIAFPGTVAIPLMAPFLVLPLQLVATCCLNSLYLTQGQTYKDLDDIHDKLEYRSEKWEAQSSDIVQRILSATLTSVLLLLFFFIIYGTSN